MGWESRRGRGQYYTRTRRVGGRIRREYVGAGMAGRRAAAEDARLRAVRRARAEALREEAERWAEAEGQLDDFIRVTEALARAALMGANYFRHNRGAWRRRRRNMPKTTMTTPEMPAPPVPDPGEAEEKAARQKIEEMVRRAEEGDASVMPQLKIILDMAPSQWQGYGNLGARVEAIWLNMMAGQNLMLRESWRRELEAMRTELKADTSSPLERLLSARVTATWLQVQCADAGAAMVQGGEAAQETMALRRQNAAQKRYLQAVKALAVVQRLLRPRVSPAEVATRLGAGGTAGGRRTTPVGEGAGVLN